MRGGRLGKEGCGHGGKRAQGEGVGKLGRGRGALQREISANAAKLDELRRR